MGKQNKNNTNKQKRTPVSLYANPMSLKCALIRVHAQLLVDPRIVLEIHFILKGNGTFVECRFSHMKLFQLTVQVRSRKKENNYHYKGPVIYRGSVHRYPKHDSCRPVNQDAEGGEACAV